VTWPTALSWESAGEHSAKCSRVDLYHTLPKSSRWCLATPLAQQKNYFSFRENMERATVLGIHTARHAVRRRSRCNALDHFVLVVSDVLPRNVKGCFDSGQHIRESVAINQNRQFRGIVVQKTSSDLIGVLNRGRKVGFGLTRPGEKTLTDAKPGAITYTALHSSRKSLKTVLRGV
jgi:hypothetical protein